MPLYSSGETIMSVRPSVLLLALVACALGASAHATPMQLVQQGRLLDGSGTPLTGTQTLVFNVRDGSGDVQFSETFTGVTVADGYYAVQLGVGSTPLDTAVFLEHGAMSLQVDANGSALGAMPLGGYPLVVAQQSLLARETSVQQLLSTVADTGLYSETCTDFSARGWATQDDCLHDGRWHKVYDQTGTGSIADVKTHALAGASFRVVTDQNPAMFDCVSISFDDRNYGGGSGHVVCHSPITAHPGPHNQTNNTAYQSAYDLWTSGAVYYTQRNAASALSSGRWHVNANGRWYVRY